jgi:hypothetical protein
LFPLSFSLPASVLLHVPKQFNYHIRQVLLWHKYNSRWKSLMLSHHVAWYSSTTIHGVTTHKTVRNLYTHYHVNFKFHIICIRSGTERRKRLHHALFDGKIILKGILKKQAVVGGFESATCHEHRNEPSCFIQGRKFFNKLNDHHLLCDCVSWN